MQRADFAYELPAALIAQAPLVDRTSSRLMIVPNDTSSAVHSSVRALPQWLSPDDLLVVNDTRVIKARLFGNKDTGGRVEVLVERVESEFVALCQLRTSKPFTAERTVYFHDADNRAGATLENREGPFYRLRFDVPVAELLLSQGSVPLPPYITRQADENDERRYQTVFAEHDGAVAAPTAGLHFSDGLLDEIDAMGVTRAALTLHVGAGTFSPVRVACLGEHKMHRERYVVSAELVAAVAACRARGGRVIAVGTTVVRALESVAAAHGRLVAEQGETQIFITPGFEFRVVDVLMTNFHLPESTLLMLVCAFAGYERVMQAYDVAVREGYRFFSYGDAMLLMREAPHEQGTPK